MLDLKHRATTDIVVLLFTLLIFVVLTLMITGAMIAKLMHPELEMRNITESVAQMISTILGALVGFISGRAYGRRETNGQTQT